MGEMDFNFERIRYEDLNSREQENYNFQKASAVLADFGFATLRLSADWKGADFLAHHISGKTLKVQLKGRFDFQKKYLDKDLWICFPHKGDWYFYPHDEVVKIALSKLTFGNTDSWKKRGGWNSKHLSKAMKKILAPYQLPADPAEGVAE
jgi:hypothetical protein